MRRAVQIIAAAVFLAGAAVFLGPYVNRWMADQDASDVIETFEVETAVGREDAGDRGEDVDASAGGADLQSEDYAAGVSAEALAALREELSAYNREIYENGQAGLKDPFSYETPGFDLTEYGFSQNVIGVLWIPRIEENLPIYLGADHDNMAKGAALLGETSMPLGETDSNTVIAAHRGWKGIPMLRNIQQLQIGDKIQITTPWDVLIYRVCDLKIISPDDSQEIFIQEGRELVTLLTCHPYTQHTRRYAVFCTRTTGKEAVSGAETPNDEKAEVSLETAEEAASEDGDILRREKLLRTAGYGFLAVIGAAIAGKAIWNRAGRRRRFRK